MSKEIIIRSNSTAVDFALLKNGKLIDMFPTVMSLIKMNYTNYTLGSNLLDTLHTREPSSFVYLQVKGEPAVGLLQDSLYYSKTNITKTKSLYNLKSDNLEDLKAKYPKKALEMDSLLNAYYHATKYLYFNNKKENTNCDKKWKIGV